MKKLIAILTLAIVAICCFPSCTKHDTNIRGTYEYRNESTGSVRIWKIYEFKANGNVVEESQIGTTPKFSTEGCSLYYTLNGTDLVIYHGVKGWKKEVRNTPYASGSYYGDHIEIDGKIFKKW